MYFFSMALKVLMSKLFGLCAYRNLLPQKCQLPVTKMSGQG